MVDIIGSSVGVLLIVVGLILFAIEITHPGAFLLIPASIVLAAGILYIAAPDVLLASVYGPAVIVIVALVAALATIPYYRYIAPIHQPMSTTAGSLEGETGIVITSVVPDTLRGKVRVRSEVWSARSEAPIPAGTKVRIVRGEGVSLHVQPLEPELGGG